MMVSLKEKLYEQCLLFVQKRLANIQQAIDNAGESANDETKSSAGDKHETGRAMAQLEQEKNSKQLSEAIELKKQLEKINPNQQSEKVAAGSIVATNKGRFYISISAGKLIVDKEIFFAVSPTSPIAVQFMGLEKKGKISINGTEYKIESVF